MYQGMSRSSLTTAWLLSRASGVEVNPMQITSRANQFATKTSGFDSTTLLLRREESTLRGYLLTEGTGANAMRAATDLAHAVGAKAESVPIPAGLVAENVVGWLVFESGSSVAREPQVGSDPTEVARLMANTLSPDCWIAVTLRKPTKKERKRHGLWLANRLSTAVPTHHSMSGDAVIISVLAGSPDAKTVDSLLESTRSAMQGFDIITKAKVATRASAASGWFASAALSVAAGFGSLFVSGSPDVYGPAILAPGLALGAGSVLVGSLRFAGVMPSMWSRTQRDLAAGHFRAPRTRRTKPKAPRSERHVGEKTIKGHEGDYPLHPSSFLVGPQVIVGVVAPHAGAISGEASTQTRAVPPSMLHRIGPLIGNTDQGPAYLSAIDAFGGVAVVGKAGSGKSVLVRSLFGWSCLDRQTPTLLPGFPGAHNALIAFESKGDGVDHYQQWSDTTGDVMVVIDIADPATFGIDLFAVPGTPTERANFFVNAMVYAFGEGAIGDRSFETLLSVLPAALSVTPELAALVPDLNPHGSPIYYTHVLLGGRGDDLGRALVNELAGESVRNDGNPEVHEAIRGLSPLYGAGVTATQRRNLAEAPRNKVRQLLELEAWWTPARRKVTWDQILNDHRIVVINTGTSRDGKIVEDELCRQMSAILMFSLRHAIQRNCSGWQEQSRSVSIFADELSLLAGSSEAVIAWLKDQGRAFGVRPFLATQRPEQLPDKVRSAFMNFSTLVSYMQEDITTARQIAEGVSGEDGEWTAADILQLNTYTAVVRGHVDKKRQPAFTVAVRNFEADRRLFANEQGYAIHAQAESSPVSPVLALDNPSTAADYTPEAVEVVQAPVLADPVIPAPVVIPVTDEAPTNDISLSEW